MDTVLFDEEFTDNQVYYDQPCGFMPPEKERIGAINPGMARQLGVEPSRGEEIETGYRILPNGDISFRILAPSVDTVKIHFLSFDDGPLVLTKGGNGIHEGIFEYRSDYCGAASIDVLFDDTVFLYPYLPIFWHRNRPVNFIEIPELETSYIHIRNVPHGTMSREIFRSDTFSNWQRGFVYTPPGYEKGADYPILYLHAGGGENETSWEYCGRLAHIMDNTIADGLCVPMIVAVPDGGGVYKDRPEDSISGHEDMLLKDFIPFIEGKYKVRRGKKNRAIAGLSRGGHQAFAIAVTHPEFFGALGVFSAYMFHPDRDPEDPAYYNRAYLEDPDRFAKDFDVFFRSMGEDDFLLPEFIKDDIFFEEKGIAQLPVYTRVTYPHKGHLWNAFRPALRDFIQLIFR